MSYLYVFFQSFLLEAPIYFLLFKPEFRIINCFGLTFTLNSITHPIVFFGLMNLPLNFLSTILLAEAFAWLSEAFVLHRSLDQSWPRALAASGLANLCSWQLGPMLTYAFFG